jgi:hypothetical protein
MTRSRQLLADPFRLYRKVERPESAAFGTFASAGISAWRING